MVVLQSGGMGTQGMMHEIYRNRVPAGVVQLRHVVRDECKAKQCNARKMIGNTNEWKITNRLNWIQVRSFPKLQGPLITAPTFS